MLTPQNGEIRNYFYDEQLFNKLKKKICPDCESNLTRKGIKTYCPNCNFEIYGNPQYLSYKHKDQTTIEIPGKIHQTDSRCPCGYEGPFDHDFKHDETCCPRCGIVLAGPPGYVAGNLKIVYPWHYNFEAETVWIKSNNERIIGFYYYPEYYKDPEQFVSYHKK